MEAEEIRTHVVKEPFEPFRLYVSDGRRFLIRNPTLLLVTRHVLHVGITRLPRKGIADRTECIQVASVTRIEPINGKKPPRRRSA